MLKQQTEAVKCSTCRHFGDGNVHGVPPMDGACHFQPPFPRVRPEDWCSHWAIKHDKDPTLERMILQLERMLAAGKPRKCATEAPVSGEAPLKRCMNCKHMIPHPSIRLGVWCQIHDKRTYEMNLCDRWEGVSEETCDKCRYFPENIHIECRKAKRRVTEKDHCLWWTAIQRDSGIFVYSWWQLANPKIGQEIWR